MKKVRKILSTIITLILSITLLFMIFVVISSKASGGEPNFLGYQLKTVLSGSMEPTFMTGSVISVKPVQNPTSLIKGDVITFMIAEDQLATHRIIDVIKNDNRVMYKTKGDNNASADSELVLSKNVVGEYTGFTIPYAGYLIDFSKSKNGSALMLILPGLLLIAYSVMTILKALKEIDKPGNRKEIHETL